LVLEKRLYFDARSEKHQIMGDVRLSERTVTKFRRVLRYDAV